MSDNFPKSGANAAEAKRYTLDHDEIIIAHTRWTDHVPANPTVIRTSLQLADDSWQCG